MNKIESCPFCGGADLEVGRSTKDREGWPTYVICVTCGAYGPWIYTRRDLDLEHACDETGWNKRFNADGVRRSGGK